MSTLKYLSISLALVFSLPVIAQESAGDKKSAEDKKKALKEKVSFRPTGVRMGTNVARLGRSVFDSEYSSWGITSDIDFHRYLLEINYGYEKLESLKEKFDFSARGNFLRIGPEVNFIKDKTEANALIFGIKYVRVQFEDALQFEEVSNFGNQMISLKGMDLSARWMELNVGIKVNLFSHFYSGFYIRHKINRVIKGKTAFITYKVPGFGLAEDQKNRVGFDYFVYWRIPFKKN